MAWTTPRDWTNGEIVTQTMLNTDVRDNMRELWHEVAYVEFAASVSITATTDATAHTIVSSGAITYTALPVLVEFYSPSVQNSTDQVTIVTLWDASTNLGWIGRFGGAATLPNGERAAFCPRRLTPSAASHTYMVKAFTTGGTGSVQAGAGGAGASMPGYIRVLQKGGA